LARELTILTQVLPNFLQYLQASARIVLQLVHDGFLPNPFQFVIHISSYYLMPLNTYSHFTAKMFGSSSACNIPLPHFDYYHETISPVPSLVAALIKTRKGR
jgi:hypothetical protein